jgi:hypothetical protein
MRRRAEQCLAAVLAGAVTCVRLSGAEPLAPAGEAAARAPRAPIEASIEVEREPGAEACPDAAAVFRSLARLFPERAFREGSDAATAAASARVVIRAAPRGYEAVLSTRAPHAGERVISEQDETCAGLADALALAFVMLVEPTAASAESSSAPGATPSSTSSAASPPAPAAKVEPARSVPPPSAGREAVAPAPPPPRSFTGNVTGSALGGFGLLSKPAGGAAVGLELFHASGWGGSLAGVRLWSPAATARGGSLGLSLWALLAGPCYELRLSGASSGEACVRLGAGSEHARVHGFLSPRSPSVLWAVVAPALGYRLRAAAALTGFVRVGPVVQLRPQSFSASTDDGSGRTVQIAGAPNLGVMAELGLSTGGVLF